LFFSAIVNATDETSAITTPVAHMQILTGSTNSKLVSIYNWLAPSTQLWILWHPFHPIRDSKWTLKCAHLGLLWVQSSGRIWVWTLIQL